MGWAGNFHYPKYLKDFGDIGGFLPISYLIQANTDASLTNAAVVWWIAKEYQTMAVNRRHPGNAGRARCQWRAARNHHDQRTSSPWP
jgi:hypothetical protein